MERSANQAIAYYPHPISIPLLSFENCIAQIVAVEYSMQTVLGTNCNIYRKDILNYFLEGLKFIKLLNDLPVTFYTKSKTIIATFPQDYQCHVGLLLDYYY